LSANQCRTPALDAAASSATIRLRKITGQSDALVAASSDVNPPAFSQSAEVPDSSRASKEGRQSVRLRGRNAVEAR